ncbi:MAG: hypothetical protein WBR09_11770 [Serratia proteamaculans]
MKDCIIIALWLFILFSLIEHSSLLIMEHCNSYVDVAIAVITVIGTKALLTWFEDVYYWFTGRER